MARWCSYGGPFSLVPAWSHLEVRFALAYDSRGQGSSLGLLDPRLVRKRMDREDPYLGKILTVTVFWRIVLAGTTLLWVCLSSLSR